jgi:hypothetical protein
MPSFYTSIQNIVVSAKYNFVNNGFNTFKVNDLTHV